MVDVAGVRGIGVHGVDWGMRSHQPFEDPKRRLDQLVPLLHELVAWDLVQRADDGSFVLRQDVQERLAVLTADRPTRSAEVFVGPQVPGVRQRQAHPDGRRGADVLAVQPGHSTRRPRTTPTDGRSRKGHRGFFHRHRAAS